MFGNYEEKLHLKLEDETEFTGLSLNLPLMSLAMPEMPPMAAPGEKCKVQKNSDEGEYLMAFKFVCWLIEFNNYIYLFIQKLTTKMNWEFGLSSSICLNLKWIWPEGKIRTFCNQLKLPSASPHNFVLLIHLSCP